MEESVSFWGQNGGFAYCPDNKDNVSLWARERFCLKTIRKDSGYSTSEFLFCDPALAGVIWCSLCWGFRNWFQKMMIPWGIITIAEGNKTSFVPDPGVSCLLLAGKEMVVGKLVSLQVGKNLKTLKKFWILVIRYQNYPFSPR